MAYPLNVASSKEQFVNSVRLKELFAEVDEPELLVLAGATRPFKLFLSAFADIELTILMLRMW